MSAPHDLSTPPGARWARPSRATASSTGYHPRSAWARDASRRARSPRSRGTARDWSGPRAGGGHGSRQERDVRAPASRRPPRVVPRGSVCGVAWSTPGVSPLVSSPAAPERSRDPRRLPVVHHRHVRRRSSRDRCAPRPVVRASPTTRPVGSSRSRGSGSSDHQVDNHQQQYHDDGADSNPHTVRPSQQPHGATIGTRHRGPPANADGPPLACLLDVFMNGARLSR